MIQDVFIIGATGKVGSTLVRQIFDKGDTDSNLHANPTRIVGLASSRHFRFSSNGISRKDCIDFTEKKHNGVNNYENLDEILEVVDKKRDGNAILTFVDVTALNEPMTEFHKNIITKTRYSIVTANKNPISLSDTKTFRKLTEKPRRYGYRCSVMAGAEAVLFLRDLRDVNDFPRKIEGCFSGTLGYMTSGLEDGKDFSAILNEAYKKGFTEPDPRDDLNGLDVARKLIVLARSAGFDVGTNDIELKPFIPEKYFRDESIPSFLKRTPDLDGNFKERMRSALDAGNTLRYVAEMSVGNNKPELEVTLKEVPRESPLGRLHGTSNKIVIISGAYPEENPYSIEAPGAGLQVTAENIRKDLLDHLKERTSSRD